MKYITTVDDQQFEIEVVDEHHIRIGDRLLQVDFESVSGQPVFSLILDGRSYESFVYQGEEDWDVLLRGRQYQVKVEDEREKRLKAAPPSCRSRSTVAPTSSGHRKPVKLAYMTLAWK